MDVKEMELEGCENDNKHPGSRNDGKLDYLSALAASKK
jgi:hypothetical protein